MTKNLIPADNTSATSDNTPPLREVEVSDARATIMAKDDLMQVTPEQDTRKSGAEQDAQQEAQQEEQQTPQQNGERGKPIEHGGPKGLEPTRYGDWEQKGRCTDF